MHERTSNPAIGALPLVLLMASLLSFGSAASADWLVTHDGAAVETRGAWEIKGETVIFTSPTGVLSSLALADVNLQASEAHTEAVVRAAASAHEVEVPVERRAVMVLTDSDVRHAEPETPTAEDTGEAATVPAPREPGSSLVVTEWEEDFNVNENSLDVVGSLRNSGRNPATSINLSVLLYSDSGALLGKREARLVRPVLNPGESTRFIASFSSGLTFSSARFDIQSRGFRNHDPTHEKSEEELVPEGN